MGEEVGGFFGLWQVGFVLVSRGFSFCSVYRTNGKVGGYRATSGRASFWHDSSASVLYYKVYIRGAK